MLSLVSMGFICSSYLDPNVCCELAGSPYIHLIFFIVNELHSTQLQRACNSTIIRIDGRQMKENSPCTLFSNILLAKAESSHLTLGCAKHNGIAITQLTRTATVCRCPTSTSAVAPRQWLTDFRTLLTLTSTTGTRSVVWSTCNSERLI